jgi:exodeoxyribonuclease VII large subunit
LNRHQSVDVVIVGRGGGSLEDLWAFNDENVARAIVASRIPVVSGVGHEVDITIADLVADQRAATPTAAATLVVPDQHEVRQWLRRSQQQLAVALRRQAALQIERLQSLRRSYGLQRPQRLIDDCRQRLLDSVSELQRAMDTSIALRQRSLEARSAQLRALSPRGVLERGYTYCVDEETGELVAAAIGTRPDQPVRLHFFDGAVRAQLRGQAVPATPRRKDNP